MNKCLLVLFLLLPLILFAQEKKNLQFIHYSTEQGLSSSEVQDIVQDNHGFIWVGTEDGLNRFDSYNFKVYRKKFNDPSSLAHNLISALFVDSKGDLWVGTQQGLSLYDRNFDSFINYYPVHDDFTSQSNYISSITEDNKHRLFIGMQFGKVFMFNSNTDSFNEVLNLGKGIEFLFFDSDNHLWVLTDEIYIYNEQMNLVKTITNPEVKFPFNCIIEDDDKYWISTIGSGLFWYDKKNKSLIRSFKNGTYEDYINIIYKDRENNIWIGCSNSLKLFNRYKDTFYYYYHVENSKYSLMTSGVTSFLQDNEGNYWVLTAKGGLNVSLVKKKFSILNPDTENKTKLTKRIISAIMVDDDNKLWAGSFNAGIDLIDFSEDTLIHFENIPSDTKSMGEGSVLTLFEDSKKNIWVSSFRGGLQQYNKKDKSFTSYKHDLKNPKSIAGEDIRAITEDKEGNLWLATNGKGLDKYNPETNMFYHYRQDPDNNKTRLVNDWLYAVLCDSEEFIWIGSSFGLSRLNKDRKTFTNFFHDPADSNSLSNNFINYLFEDSKKNLWIGTNEGLNLYNKKNKTFCAFLQKDGLSNNVIQGIQEDKRGNLWISTNFGISKFDPVKETYRNYSIHDGLPSNEFNPGACFKDKKGQIFFGSNNGIVVFHPDSIQDDLQVPPVYITGFKIFNKTVLPDQDDSILKKDIIQTEEIVLKHELSTVLSFEFVSVSYIQSDKKQYAYMMEGFDEDWVYCGNKREATYTNLDPGEYIFRVKASNHDNIWNEKGAFIKITILPPWWQTVWFRISIILFIIGLFIVFYFNKISSLKKQTLQLEKLVRKRTKEIKEKNETLTSLNATKDKFFTIIAHDLKNPFNSILGLIEVLVMRYDNYDDIKRKSLLSAIRNSSIKVYELLENLLQWSRSQTGAIKFKPEVFSLHEVIKNNTDLIQNVLKEKNIKLNFEISPDYTVYADRNMINTVIRNLLSNAVKFIQKGEISVSAVKENNYIKVFIKDTGIGMSIEQLESLFTIEGAESTKGTMGESGTGLGLIICKEFIEKNNGSISVESELNKGTTFIITLRHKP